MDTPMVATRTSGRKPLAALGKLTLIALLGMMATVAYVVLGIFGEADAMGLVLGGIPLLGAALIATGWRWAPVLGALVGGVLLFFVGPFFLFLVRNPGEPVFAPILILVVLCVVAIVGGLSATVQNYRRPLAERRMPRWLPAALTALVGLVAGALLIAAVPKPGTAAGVSPEILAELPPLTTAGFEFEQTEIRAKVGETVALRLENHDPESHSFDIDELDVHAPMPAGETGLALFKPTKPGTYTFYCAPHYDKASGQGMKGTLIVEP